MPLHLLGKKSWNVYNPAKIARVRRDEAEARAREEAEEQRMQQADADRRLAILRGEIPPPLEEAPSSKELSTAPPRDGNRSSGWTPGTTGRKRKRHGEDDTDYEMRLARERALVQGSDSHRGEEPGKPSQSSSSSAALVDSTTGHITLFSEADVRAAEKNEEHEWEAARKKRELADQYQMRFANAAGRDGQESLTGRGPWYASADGEASAALVPSRDVWGREDPGRKVREAVRLGASDPLAMMKSGAAKVRELERARKREAEERERELEALRKEERRRERKRRRELESDRRSERPRDSPDKGDYHSGRERAHRRRDADGEELPRRRSKEREKRPDDVEEDGHEKRRHRSDGRRRHRHRSRSRDRDRARDRARSTHNHR
ncbi:hypothetical protein N656DRAFT_739452 [Canariomyces notabilis]|uniref:CBF1-interacting co-repressor CIR N-terminal domain-containing protein n=1 Tax=Canariomyces notabilis TaxID=2074819 RepID=A0AAN6QEH5_9PEZI|nr:hypothetical protein N656DRAFT_739452 [Canariomyces arenarius]